ncbi:vacuolar protein sorting-associated protein 37A [Schistocerca americana]|uniref:vacuolar protein sorting-associated protein 37A n=1 Tax=Schistocerca americana TaxID=7009 RepID=UPI001F4F5E88|nr:vacuolar protein sorting-associated protein 37A [Schistocerca americana]XP_049946362.1 vacuolar protein sorting-associated protein 37A [Schistocerca serialis cubense]
MISRLYGADSDNASLKRKRQIDTLKIFNANVTEVHADVEYRVDFVSGDHQMALHVILGPEFPLEKPILRVVPAVSHLWVNETGEVVGAPGLISFTVHSDLGRVVQAIIREFEKNPPPLAANINIPNSMLTGGAPAIPPALSTAPQPQLQLPPEPSELRDLLAGMSVAELEELRRDGPVADDRLAELVSDLPPLRRMEQQRDQLVAGIVALAESNLSRQPELQAAREAVRAKAEKVSALRARFEELGVEHRRLAERYAPDNIRETLCLAAQQSDEESDAVAEAFLSGRVDVERFAAQYIRIRALSHERKTKEEKLQSQLRELQRAGY